MQHNAESFILNESFHKNLEAAILIEKKFHSNGEETFLNKLI